MMRLLLVLVVCCCRPDLALADSCADVLKLPRDYKSVKKTFTTSQVTKEWFCSDAFTKEIENHDIGFNITIPIDDKLVKFGAKINNDQSLTQRDKFCRDDRKTFTQAESLRIVTLVTPQTTQDAWLKCMVSKDSNVVANYQPGTGKDFLIGIRRRFGSGKLIELRGLGATCEAVTEKNNMLTNNEQNYKCSRDGGGQAVVDVKTDGENPVVIVPPQAGTLAGTYKLVFSGTQKVRRVQKDIDSCGQTPNRHNQSNVHFCVAPLHAVGDEEFENFRIACFHGESVVCQFNFNPDTGIGGDKKSAKGCWDVGSRSHRMCIQVAVTKPVDETRKEEREVNLGYATPYHVIVDDWVQLVTLTGSIKGVDTSVQVFPVSADANPTIDVAELPTTGQVRSHTVSVTIH